MSDILYSLSSSETTPVFSKVLHKVNGHTLRNRKGYWPNWQIEKQIKNGNELVKVKGKDKG